MSSECRHWTRRRWIAAAGAAVLTRPARSAPLTRVALGRCDSYGEELVSVMKTMFDQIGGLERLVRDKTVAIKINMTGNSTARLGHVPVEASHWTHPNIVGAAIHLIGRAGARRIRVLESFSYGTDPLEEHMLLAGWEPNVLLNAARHVEIENTGFLGYGKRYSRMMTPGGGYIYSGFDLNHSYEECDVFVSIAKLKEHFTAGVTLSMKNLFGIAPPTIYGNGALVFEPALVPNGGRQMFHTGDRQPSRTAPGENDPSSPRDGGYRVPRIVVDLVSARPIHLSIIDGIETITGAEGPWIRKPVSPIRCVSPRVIIVGTNPVEADAVATAVMDFDPMADRGTAPFEECDSTLRLAEERGIGTRDLSQIEVAGPRIQDVVFRFRTG